MIFNISNEEKKIIEALYFEKNAKENILSLFMEKNEYTLDDKVFNRIYEEAISANIAYLAAYNEIVSKYIPVGLKYKNSRIEFFTNELIVEEV